MKGKVKTDDKNEVSRLLADFISASFFAISHYKLKLLHVTPSFEND